ncbi:uncharacterized protein [Henckelia pumila]|uniref:uncharacterized protein n=1 Tax=Henckelia pumila TaxID=405737 RepID=UPI003C6E99FC
MYFYKFSSHFNNFFLCTGIATIFSAFSSGSKALCIRFFRLDLKLGTILIQAQILQIVSLFRRVFDVSISIALLLGDGLYNFVKTLCVTMVNFHIKLKTRSLNSVEVDEDKALSSLKQDEMFIREKRLLRRLRKQKCIF